MIADMQALLSAGDDVLNAKGDQSGVVTIGDFVRIERLDGATFVVVSQKPTTVTGSQELIACYTSVLKQCKLAYIVARKRYVLTKCSACVNAGA